METRRLRGTDMKQLVCILRNDTHSPVDPSGLQYEKATQGAIRKLPRRLRSTILSSHGRLCHVHKDLDVHLIDDLWAWIKFELEIAVGRFLYPIIMCGILSVSEEHQLRKLEAVVQMFLPEWTLAESAPPGKQPIDTGTKWAYQENGCHACMLARIGSDEGALFTLFAGMYGHLRPRGSHKGIDQIKSKRLRFVRYWMYTHENGVQAAQEAYELGMKMKMLRHDAKGSLRRSGHSTHYTRGSLDEPIATAHHCLDGETEVGIDISAPYNPKDWATISTEEHKPKIKYRYSAPPATHRPYQINKPLPPTPPPEDDTLPPLPLLTRANLKRRDSVHSSRTLHPPSSVHSSRTPHPPSSVYTLNSRGTSIASFNAPLQPSRGVRGYDPLETQEERVQKYRMLLCGDEGRERGLLPKPSYGSMYRAYGEEGSSGEEFEVVDDTPPVSPLEEKFKEEEEGEVMAGPTKGRAGKELVANAARKKIRYPSSSAAEFDSAPVTIVAGMERLVTYYVHRSYLTSSSDFFKNALSGGWKESSTNNIALREYRPEIVKVYVDWLYTGRICTSNENDTDCSGSTSQHGHLTEWDDLEDCYALGGFLQDVSFKDNMLDAVIDKMIRHSLQYTGLPLMVYSTCSAKSPHRQLALDLIIETWPAEKLNSIAREHFPADFLADVLVNMAKVWHSGREAQGTAKFFHDLDTCKYHEHTMNGSPCYKVKPIFGNKVSFGGRVWRNNGTDKMRCHSPLVIPKYSLSIYSALAYLSLLLPPQLHRCHPGLQTAERTMSTPDPPPTKKRRAEGPPKIDSRKKSRYPVDSAINSESELVSLVVGGYGSGATYRVHRERLFSSSDFFKNELEENGKGGAPPVIKLGDEKPTTVKIYIKWLYTGRISTKPATGHRSRNVSGQILSDEFLTFSECYHFGELIKVPDFKDSVIDAWSDQMCKDGLMCLDFPYDIYKSSAAGSPHRQLALDLTVNTWSFAVLKDIKQRHFSEEIITDILVEMAGVVDTGRQLTNPRGFLEGVDMCRYHEHTVRKTPCYKSKHGH
ncbi:hypothetical protein OPT61_g5079 [Boeremia exigua]|uniref:Uncharacterized protein n=1 Tax=Boeremia exigua TaxID=749465 RepID=A0ACC2IBM4_9PLEO|nr:hypothetical protein OPT61_g5079 [Boeremia exigua]